MSRAPKAATVDVPRTVKETAPPPPSAPATSGGQTNARSYLARWADYIINVMKAESELAGGLINHPTRVGDAREALIQLVLSRIIPSTYEIGSGQIVDSRGGISQQIDIVIARRDFPCLRFGDGTAHYLVESVIAAIEVKSELSSKNFGEALSNCKSVGDLSPDCEPSSLIKMTRSIGLEVTRSGRLYKQIGNNTYATPPGILSQLAETVTRPECYIFGFSGYKSNVEDFKAQLRDWMRDREDLSLRSLPAVVASAGCLALRNQYGQSYNGKDRTWPALLVRRDDNPLWYLIQQLLYKIHLSVPIQKNANGLVHTMGKYLELHIPKTYEGIVTIHDPPLRRIEIPAEELIPHTDFAEGGDGLVEVSLDLDLSPPPD